METEDLLKELGLSKTEQRTYLGLIKIGESKTGELCSETQIPSSKIYSVLDSLIKKGLVTFSTKNNIKFFYATSPDSLKLLFDKKRQELDDKQDSVLKLIKTLKSVSKNESQATKYKYYEGIQGIKSLYLEIIGEMDKNKDNVLKIHSANREMTERLLGFYEKFHLKRLKKKVKYRLILPEDLRKNAEKRKRQLSEVRIKKINSEVSWGVFGNLFFLNYNGGKNPYGIIVNDALTARTFETVFDEIWTNANRT